MSLNKVMLIGNVGRDPEVRYLEGSADQQGAKVATFTLATTERYRDRSGELRENTEWHNIVAWRNSADIAEKYVKKGTQLYIEGKLRTRSWTDQAGVKKYTTEVVVDNLQLLGRKADNPGAQEGFRPASQQGYAQSPSFAPAQQPSVQRQSYAPAQQPQAYAPVQPAQSFAPQPAAPAQDDPVDDLPF